MDSIFLVKYRFRTRDNSKSNKNAAITHAFNWFGYLFDDSILRLNKYSGNYISFWKFINNKLWEMR